MRGPGHARQTRPPRTLSEADYRMALNATFSPSRFDVPVSLTPAGVSGWYSSYASQRGYWQALTRIASDNGHACNVFFLTAAFTDTAGELAPVYRYEFRAAGGHPGQVYPGAVHASELDYVFRTPSPYEHHTLSPEQDALAKVMQSFWGQLARSARLNSALWPACTPGVHPCDSVMIFDTPNAMVESERVVDDGSAARQCAHWAEFM